MKSIYMTEEALFKRWEESSILDEDYNKGGFAKDGLLYRGEIFQDRNGFWHRNRGNEENQWLSSRYRLMFLTKDLNDKCAWDIREETGRVNGLKNGYYENKLDFYKNIKMWSYGLLTIARTGNKPLFELANNDDVNGSFYENAPIVRINCKKQCGGSSIKDSKLFQYMGKYPFWKEQVNIYGANIIVCCGYSETNGGIVKNLLNKECGLNLQIQNGTGEWIYYSPTRDIIIINSYHPTYTTYKKISQEKMYNYMMDGFINFCLKNDPDWRGRQKAII